MVTRCERRGPRAERDEQRLRYMRNYRTNRLPRGSCALRRRGADAVAMHYRAMCHALRSVFRSPSAVLRGLSTRTTVSDSTGGGTTEPISLAPDDDLWANSPPGSRTNASTPREVSWTDPEAVERRHITLQPTLPKTPSQEQRGHVHV